MLHLNQELYIVSRHPAPHKAFVMKITERPAFLQGCKKLHNLDQRCRLD